MIEQYSEILSIEELCEILAIGKNVAYRLLSEKEIKAFKIGKKWKIPKNSVKNFILENMKWSTPYTSQWKVNI